MTEDCAFGALSERAIWEPSGPSRTIMGTVQALLISHLHPRMRKKGSEELDP